MKIYTSYFYQVRFFKSNMLPMSTAIWDPKWFHDFKDQKHLFIDKRGIVNGLRMPAFAPGESCTGLCTGVDSCKDQNPEKCKFLKAYKKQLKKLNFDKVMNHLTKCCDQLIKFDDPAVVLLFHEIPNNPCSERKAVQDWFNEHGIEVTELKYPIKDNY